DDVGLVLGERDGGAPGDGGPVHERDVEFYGALGGVLRILREGDCETGVFYFEAAETVILGAEIEVPSAEAERGGLGQVGGFDFVSGLLNPNVRILGEAAGGSEEQATMLGAFGEKAFDEFEAERDSLADEIRVVVGSECVAAIGEGVA